ncbi:hypothetical protein Tco_0730067 [Tanacetum coccineum]|uniref:Uncharacterized protein n=1 Tax=Tanacetum coccineum TaxID=301880 RepID=A0ABQ4YRY1_9ASTR
MAESYNPTQIPSSPNVTPKEEPITLERPESPNPFLPTDQVEFNFDEMLFTTNNEVARVYPDHTNLEYFQLVSDFISKSLENSRIWVSTPTGGVRGEIGVTIFRNATGAHFSDEYVDSPSLTIVKPWFAKIGYNREIGVKGTLKNSCLTPRERVIPYPRFIYLLLEYMAPEYANKCLTINPTQVFSVNNWALKQNQRKEPPFTEHILTVCNTDVPNVPKVPKPSFNAERVPQGTKPGAKLGHKKHSTSSTQPFMSSSEATKASYISHSESASGNDASADFTTEADPEIFDPNDYVPHQQGPDEVSKYYTPDHTFAGTNPSILVYTTKSMGDGSQTVHSISSIKVDTRTAFRDDEHQDNEPFIAPEESSEENVERNKDTHKLEQDKQKAATKIATLKAQSVFPNINQLTEHLVSSMKPEFSKLLSSYDFSSSISTELKELPTKIIALSGGVNEVNKHIKDLTTHVDELKKHKWELPKEFLDLPGQISLVHSHIQTLKALLGKSTASPAKGEKNTNPVTENAELANLVDLIGKTGLKKSSQILRSVIYTWLN